VRAQQRKGALLIENQASGGIDISGHSRGAPWVT
jgi:hypothetical protein